MKRIHQIYNGPFVYRDGYCIQGGDCVDACIASILEIPIEKSDFVYPFEDHNWYSLLRERLEEAGYSFVGFEEDPKCASPYIGIFSSGIFSAHAVVMKSGRIIHNPTPKKARPRNWIKRYFRPKYIVIGRKQLSLNL